ncbi:hypothetical protein CIP107509_01689 [Corynebacterium diphtheriae]|nr:hypothetical protein CIP107509_01689 [Corynebacterium diphtheriae]CAB0657155.1 hypothetical protein CIP107563_01608 [Corynebacterium diphtheriae]
MPPAIPSAAPQNTVIVTVIEAEPINEYPTCRQPKVLRDHVEFLRGIALGFRNLDHYILRRLIHVANIRYKINEL